MPVLATVALAVASLWGCSEEASPRSAPTESVELRTPDAHRQTTTTNVTADHSLTGDADLSIPLSVAELLPPSPATSEVIWATTERLKQSCMAERGFDYEPLPSPGYLQAWSDQRQAEQMTAERAATNAYHPSVGGDPPELQAAYARLEKRTADAAYLAALGAQPNESGTAGCTLLAQQRLAVDVDLSTAEFNRVILDAERQVAAAVRDDASYVAALSDWAACMAVGGYIYRTPDDAFADPRWTNSQSPSDEERGAARFDAQCRNQTGLDNARRDAQHFAVAKWIDNNRSLVEGLRAAEAKLLAAAESAR